MAPAETNHRATLAAVYDVLRNAAKRQHEQQAKQQENKEQEATATQ